MGKKKKKTGLLHCLSLGFDLGLCGAVRAPVKEREREREK